MNNLDYRGQESTTYKLVLLAFLTATALVLDDKLSGSEWVTGALGLVSAYVLKQVGQSASEAYQNKPAAQLTNAQTVTTTTTNTPKDDGQ